MSLSVVLAKYPSALSLDVARRLLGRVASEGKAHPRYLPGGHNEAGNCHGSA